jgi:two-component system, NtrC family, sensor histidine kinase KinB
MTLRGKLLLAQAPLALALIAVGVFAFFALSALGVSSQLILEDNYRSVLAAQRMKEAIERIQQAALFIATGERQLAGAQIDSNQALFGAQFADQERNVTEPGESEATNRLGRLWEDYQRALVELRSLPETAAAKSYFFADLQPVFEAVKDAADEVLRLNQAAMLKKSDAARDLARSTNRALLATTGLALIVSLLVSVGLTNRWLQPLAMLTGAVTRVGAGDFRARATVIGHDEIARLAAQFNEMTERLEEYRNSSLGQLLLAQRASQAAIDSIPDPVVVFDDGGEVLSMNDAAEELLLGGHSMPHEMLSTITPELRAALQTARTHVLEGRGPYLPRGFEDSFAVSTAEGDRWFLLRATPVREDKGRITGATVILQDVTKLRRFDELKNDLVATVAHEFRTPLTSLRMAIHLCLEGVAGPLSEKQADLLYTAREDCERLQRTVDELLDLARIQSGKIMLSLRPVVAAELLKSAWDTFRARAEEQQVTLRMEPSSRRVQALADPERIKIVFSNLLSNALRHTPAGGTIQIQALPLADRVRFEVIDSGPGIPPEYQAAIFERFFRVPGAPPGAAGLGLPLAKQIVEAHGGEIHVESRTGEGSTFWFTLPIPPADSGQ